MPKLSKENLDRLTGEANIAFAKWLSEPDISPTFAALDLNIQELCKSLFITAYIYGATS